MMWCDLIPKVFWGFKKKWWIFTIFVLIPGFWTVRNRDFFFDDADVDNDYDDDDNDNHLLVPLLYWIQAQTTGPLKQ